MGNDERIEILSLNKTTVFEPIKNKKKLKTKYLLVPLFIIALFIISFPFIRDTFILTPKNAFNLSIDYITDIITNNDYKNTLINGKFNINTNIQDLNSFNNYTFGFKNSIDNELMQYKIYMKDKLDKEYSYEVLIKDNELYHKFSSYDKLIQYGSVNKNLFKLIQNNDDFKYIVNKVSTLLKENMNEKNFSREYVTKKVNDKDVKYLRLSYIINSNEKNELIKSVLKALYNDKKSKSIIMNNLNLTDEEINLIIDSINYKEGISINLYFRDGHFSGIDLGNNIYYYNNNDFEIKINNYSFKGIKDGDKLKLNIIKNNITVGNILFHKLKENEISLDYDIYSIKGMINYSKKTNNSNFTFSINKDKNSIKIDGNISKEKKKLNKYDTTIYTPLNDESMKNVITSFYKSLEKTPLKTIISGPDENQITEYQF